MPMIGQNTKKIYKYLYIEVYHILKMRILRPGIECMELIQFVLSNEVKYVRKLHTCLFYKI